MRWLADVGWGDTFRQPPRLDETGDQIQGNRSYRIQADGEDRLLLQKSADGAWERQYRFTLQPRAFSDFSAMCEYHQTSPESHFTHNNLITLALPNSRVTLNPTRLIRTVDGQRTETGVTDPAQYDTLLLEHFGITLAKQHERV